MSGMTLTDREIDAINAVIEAGSAPRRSGTVVGWEVLEAIDRLVPCDEIDLVGTDVRVMGHYFEQVLVGGSDHVWEPRHRATPFDGDGPGSGFWAHFWEDPCSLPERTGDFTPVSTLSDFFSDRQLRSHRIYAENVGPRGLFREALLTWPDGHGCTLRLLCWRGPGRDFTERERFILRLLRPHVVTAYRAKTQDSTGSLSPRQTAILRLVALGLTNVQIASRLAMAEGTVRTHINRIFERLGATSRTDAVMRALELGILDRPPDSRSSTPGTTSGPARSED
jgi:DNA-binding CsgD family transcriptional regulator